MKKVIKVSKETVARVSETQARNRVLARIPYDKPSPLRIGQPYYFWDLADPTKVYLSDCFHDGDRFAGCNSIGTVVSGKTTQSKGWVGRWATDYTPLYPVIDIRQSVLLAS